MVLTLRVLSEQLMGLAACCCMCAACGAVAAELGHTGQLRQRWPLDSHHLPQVTTLLSELEERSKGTAPVTTAEDLERIQAEVDRKV